MSLQECSCASANYYGMPIVQLPLNVNGYDISYSYELAPEDFELFPKLNVEYRISQCQLSLWNLYTTQTSQQKVDTVAANRFAIGQAFIRKYGMTIRFVRH